MVSAVRVDRSLFAGDAHLVAPLLLGKLLQHGECVGRIVEVEAYASTDPASHSFRGRTDRNAAMFGPAGHLYCYLSYGIHVCANVVTGPVDDGAAVLIRAVEPVAGLEAMRLRRGGRNDLTDGPGKLCQAFGITLAHTGTDVTDGSGICLLDDGTAPPPHPIVGPRVGITRAVDLPWRFRSS